MFPVYKKLARQHTSDDKAIDMKNNQLANVGRYVVVPLCPIIMDLC
jgi:hypothetical protein